MSIYHDDRVNIIRLNEKMDLDTLLKRYEDSLQNLSFVMNENVEHPSHYKKEGRKECIEEMIDLFGKEAVANWAICNWYKYEYRAGEKDNNSYIQDKSKAYWCYKKYKEINDSREFNNRA